MSHNGAHVLIGSSSKMEALRRLIEKAARNRLPVLLLGESGSGKEVVARAIHEANPRGRFVPIDCGSLVGTLMESELFGHVKGSFSGAVENKKGLVELADGGTAFFDEIGDLPLEMQVKLLRLAQEREFRPVGALEWRKVDLRIIAATHRDPSAEVAAGRFREDLFYRLRVFPVHLPPLREHKEDIPELVEHFLGMAKTAGLQSFEMSAEVREALVSYDWPGNIRELKHAIDRMAALHSEGALQLCEMPSALQNHLAASTLRHFARGAENPPAEVFLLRPRRPVISLPESEAQTIRDALAATNGARGEAARLLQIGRATLYRKMKEYDLA